MKIGKKIVIDGDTFFAPDYFSDGYNFGYMYKDRYAFDNEPDEVCYVPESAFENSEVAHIVDGEEFYDTGGYTRNDLERLLTTDDGQPYHDEDGDEITVDYLFDRLWWACPETYFNEMVCDD